MKEELAGFGEIRRPSELIGLPGTSNLPRMDLDSFSLLLVLGKGSFGKVCIVTQMYIHIVHAPIHVYCMFVKNCLYYVVLRFMPQYTNMLVLTLFIIHIL